jgi:hypothetical protein
LLQGTTVIASKTESAITATHTYGVLTLSAAEFAAITDFTDLYLELVAVGFDAATRTWAAAVVTNGGTVSLARESLVNDLIVGLKADGIFSKIFRLWLFAGENQPAALTDIINTGLATASGSPAFTANAGFTGASGKIIDSNADASGWDVDYNSRSWYIWQYNNTPNSGSVLGSSPDATQPVRAWLPYSGDNAPYWRINYADSDEIGPANTNARGLWVASTANAAASAALYRNGVLVDTAGTHGTWGVLTKIFFLGEQSTPGQPYTDILSIGGFGQYLTPTECSSLYNRLRTYMVGIGAHDAYVGP